MLFLQIYVKKNHLTQTLNKIYPTKNQKGLKWVNFSSFFIQ